MPLPSLLFAWRAYCSAVPYPIRCTIKMPGEDASGSADQELFSEVIRVRTALVAVQLSGPPGHQIGSAPYLIPKKLRTHTPAMALLSADPEQVFLP